MRFLEYFTATTVQIGPFVDSAGALISADYVAATDIWISKNAGTFINPGSGYNPATISHGFMPLDLSATDTNCTQLVVMVKVSQALVVWHEFSVLAPHFFGAMFGNNPILANIVQIHGVSTADNLATLKLKSLDIRNTLGSAIHASSTNGNGAVFIGAGEGTQYGIDVSGDVGIRSTGSNGAGLHLKGGGTGEGLHAEGGSGGGQGIYATGGGVNAPGIECLGAGSGSGLSARGTQTGHGAVFQGGGISGHGIVAVAPVLGDGIYAFSPTAGDGISAIGTGYGLFIEAPTAVKIHGTTAVGMDIEAYSQGIKATSSNHAAMTLNGGQGNHGLWCTGASGGAGIRAEGGSDGHGVELTGKGMGHGVSVRAEGYGTGINVKALAGVGLYLDGGTGYAGLVCAGEGAGAGAVFQGGSGGDGISVAGGSNAVGLRIAAIGGGSHGVEITAQSGHGISVVCSGGMENHGIYVAGYGTGAGLMAVSGASDALAGCHAIVAKSNGKYGDGIRALGATTGGSGIYGKGGGIDATDGHYLAGICAEGVSGNGIHAFAGGSGYSGMRLTGNGTGHGLECVKGPTGKDIDADQLDNINSKADTIILMSSATIDAVTGIGTVCSVINLSTDTLETELAKVTVKLPSSGLIAAQNDVTSIINNTTFVTSFPEYGIIPDSGFSPYKVLVKVYDQAGNMEDPDGSDLGFAVANALGVSRSGNLYKAADCQVALGASGIAGYLKMERSGPGEYFAFYKVTAGDAAEQLIAEFKYLEGTLPKAFSRSSTLVNYDPISVTIGNTSANKEVIARAVREYNSSGITLGASSVEKRLYDIANTAATEAAGANAGVVDVDAAVASVDSRITTVLSHLPTSGRASTLSLTSATLTGNSLGESIDLITAVAKGRFKKDGDILTFYRPDLSTPYFWVQVTDTERIPL